MKTIQEFHEQYGRLPTKMDKDYIREVHMNYALSKMQVLPTPILYPGKCATCNSSSPDRKYIDLGVDFEQDERFTWVVYICTVCLKELVNVAISAGLLTLPVVEKVVEVEKGSVSDILSKLDDLSSVIRSNLPSVESDEASAKITGAEQRSTKQTSGGGSSNVSQFEDLLKSAKSKPQK